MKARILVADDEPVVLRALERFLGDRFGEIIPAESYEKAAKVIGAGRIDLALIDLKLGDRDGLELVQLLQKNNPDSSSIIMTGF
ncbi:MAG TPA: response regulator, partial [bacterium]|nr:response regulator [bacterium]